MWLPSRCPCCTTIGPVPCPTCAAAVSRPGRISPPAGIDRLDVAFDHDGVGRELVLAWKFRHCRELEPWFAACLLHRLAAGSAAEQPDLITWVPASIAGRRRRGHDQSRRLANLIGRDAGVAVTGLITRIDRRTQAGRTRSERVAEQNRFDPVRPSQRLDGAHLLIIDDVLTTGASLASAALVLRRLGAASVDAAVVSARA